MPTESNNCQELWMHSRCFITYIPFIKWKWKWKWSRSVVSDSLQPHRTIAHQAPQSMEFYRQEYWSGLPFPSPGNLPNPGLNPGLPHGRQMLYCLSHEGSPLYIISVIYMCVYVCVCVCVYLFCLWVHKICREIFSSVTFLSHFIYTVRECYVI